MIFINGIEVENILLDPYKRRKIGYAFSLLPEYEM